MTTKLSEQIKKFRTLKGISQERLAEETNLSLRTIQRVENAETEPHGDTLRRISEALQVSPDELLEWNQTEDRSVLQVMNLTALSFLFFPVLGVLVPLMIWLSKKDTVKDVNSTGRKLISFEITWCIIYYLISGTLYILPFLNLQFFEWIDQVEVIPPHLIPFLIYAVLYIWNIIMIALNSIRMKKGREVRYIPSVPIMR